MADRLDFQQLSFGLRRMGWIRFWIQTVLGIVVVGVLLFNNVGSSLARNSERALGLGPGLSLTSLAFLVLLFSLWQGWLIVRTGRAIDSADPVAVKRLDQARLAGGSARSHLRGHRLSGSGRQSVRAGFDANPGIAIGGRGMSDNRRSHRWKCACTQQHPGALCTPDRSAVLTQMLQIYRTS